MISEQIALGALRNILVPTRGSNKGEKNQLDFDGLVSKGRNTAEEKSTNLRDSTVSLLPAVKSQTAESGYSADANEFVEQEALADKDLDNGKQLEPTAEQEFGINDVRSRWRSHTDVAHPNVDFSGNAAEQRADVAAELPRPLPLKTDGSLQKSVGKFEPVITEAAENTLPLQKITDVLQDEQIAGPVAADRTKKLSIGKDKLTVQQFHALKFRNFAPSETADRFGKPFERWNVQKPATDVGASQPKINDLNLQHTAPAEIRRLGLTEKLSKPFGQLGETKARAESVPIKLDRQPELGSTRDGRFHSEMNVNALPSDKVQLTTKFETRFLTANPTNTVEHSGALPNVTEFVKGQVANPNQLGGGHNSTISSHATVSLLAVIEENSNWSGQLKALATATVAKQPRIGTTPQSLRIQLHPAELGAMDATLRISGDRLHLTLSVEQDSTLRSLLRDSHAIHNALRASGFHVDELTITGTSQQDDLGMNERASANGNAAREKTEDGERPARNQLQGERDANDQNSNELAQEPDADGLYI